MNEDIEALLEKNLFDPPESFLNEVMLKIEFLPLPVRETRKLEWIALIGGTIAGGGAAICIPFRNMGSHGCRLTMEKSK